MRVGVVFGTMAKLGFVPLLACDKARDYHVAVSRGRHVSITCLSHGCHVAVTWPSRGHHVAVM